MWCKYESRSMSTRFCFQLKYRNGFILGSGQAYSTTDASKYAISGTITSEFHVNFVMFGSESMGY